MGRSSQDCAVLAAGGAARAWAVFFPRGGLGAVASWSRNLWLSWFLAEGIGMSREGPAATPQAPLEILLCLAVSLFKIEHGRAVREEPLCHPQPVLACS